MPADAVPENALGVDGTDEELPHKLPMAQAERDIVDSAQDSSCSSKLVVIVCEFENAVDSTGKCRSFKKEAEDDQMSPWVFDLFVGHVGEDGCVD